MLALVLSGVALAGTPTAFEAGSLVIPMDIAHQDAGVLDAYGLAYELLRQGVPVHWVIQGGKAVNDPDWIDAPTHRLDQPASAASPRTFKAGPFAVAAADAARARPIVDAWRAAGHPAQVYALSARSTAEVSHTLFAAPSIVIFEDGNEDIAWRYLNAASIPDLDGQRWDASSRYNMSVAEIVGPDPAVAGDGALFDDEGLPNYCHLNAMHWKAEDTAPVTAEFRAFAEDPLTSTLTECEASLSLENDPTEGHMLTTAGVVKTGLRTNNAVITVEDPSDELLQYEGAWSPVGGSLPEFWGNFVPGTSLVRAEDRGETSALLAYGHLDGDPSKGLVTYLAGHEYSTNLPWSNNPELFGVRVFINSYFTAGCTAMRDRPVISLEGSPAADSLDLDLSLEWSNDGSGRGRDTTLVLTIPDGLSYEGNDAGAVYDPVAGTLTLSLSTLTPGEFGDLLASFHADADGEYAFEGTIRYRVEATWFEVDWSQVIELALDSDGDGLSDADEAAEGTDPTNPDSDGDGLSDGDEVDAGADPSNPDSDGDGLDDGDEVAGGTDPADADTDDDGVDDGDELADGTNPLDPDSDDDGLNDGDEGVHGTNPLDPDSDDDGASDGDEVAAGTDPLDPDSDDDGLSDGGEAAAGTDPLDTDSDDDGVSDGDEVDAGTDPLDADSDDDGLSDGDEATAGTDPLDPDTDGGGRSDGDEVAAGTDPLDASDDFPPGPDTDGDGLSDEAEGAIGTDPTNPDSDGDGLTDGEEVLEHGTDPMDPDTDDGGTRDGDEVEAGTDPLDPSDDGQFDTGDSGDTGDDVNDSGLDAGGECACTSGAAGGGWLVSGALALALRRRRR